MFVVVGRANKLNIRVLDTDTMEEHKVDLVTARSKFHASGAVLSNGLYMDYVYNFNNNNLIKYNNISVYCNELVIDDSSYSSDNSSDFDDYIETMKFFSPMAYLVCYGILLKHLSCDDFNVVIDGKSYKVARSDYESIVLFCLYSVYNNIKIPVLYTSEDISPDYSYICSNIKMFDYKDKVYFCDNMCTVIVDKNVLNKVTGVGKRAARNAKFTMLNKNMSASMASDDIFVKSDRCVKICDNKRYIFKGMTNIDELVIDMSKGADLVFDRSSKLYINKVIFNGTKKAAMRLNAYLMVDSLKSYNINKKAFDLRFYERDFLSSSTRAVLSISDYSDEEWKKFIIYVMGESLFNKVQAREDLDDEEIISLHDIFYSLAGGTIPDNVLNLTCFKQYARENAKEFEQVYKQRDVNNMISAASASKFFHPYVNGSFRYIDNRLKTYEKVFQEMTKHYEKISEIAKLTGNEVEKDYNYVFIVPYDAILFQTNTRIKLPSMSCYSKIKVIEDNVRKIKGYLRDKYDISLTFLLRQDNYDRDKFSLDVKRLNLRGGKNISNTDAQEVYDYVMSFGMEVEFNQSILLAYKIKTR